MSAPTFSEVQIQSALRLYKRGHDKTRSRKLKKKSGKCSECGKASIIISRSMFSEGFSVYSGCVCDASSATEDTRDDSMSSEDSIIEALVEPWKACQTIRGSPPKHMLWSHDEELLEAARLGDCQRLEACIRRGALLSVVRDFQGKSALHLAVSSGDVDAVALLLKSGAYINVVDWKDLTPLHYASSQPGNKGVFQKQPGLRSTMVSFLVQNGAGANPLSLKDDYTMSPTRGGEEDEQLDLKWRAHTASWLIRFNRVSTMRKFKPHPWIENTNTVEDVESIFKDCQGRHQRMWANTFA